MKPYLTIRPQTGWSALRLGELWRFRELLLTLVLRDVKVRYKQTALGVVWVVLQPLLAAGIFSFVFGSVADFEAPGGVPYFLFSFVGLAAWGAFSGALTKASGSMVGNSNLVSKIYFPRLILPLSAASSTLVDLSVTLGLMGILLATYWHFPGGQVLLGVAVLLMMYLLALGLGFILTAAAVHYRDVLYVVPVALQFLLYASPVAYAAAEVPPEYRSLYFLNPLASMLEAFRWAVLGVGEVPWRHLWYAALLSVVVFWAGAFTLKRFERTFADVI